MVFFFIKTSTYYITRVLPWSHVYVKNIVNSIIFFKNQNLWRAILFEILADRRLNITPKIGLLRIRSIDKRKSFYFNRFNQL